MKKLLLSLCFLLIITPACGDMLSDDESDDVAATEQVEQLDGSTAIGAAYWHSKSNCSSYNGDYEQCLLDARAEAQDARRRKDLATSGQEWHAAENAYRYAKRKRYIAERGIVAAFAAKYG